MVGSEFLPGHYLPAITTRSLNPWTHEVLSAEWADPKTKWMRALSAPRSQPAISLPVALRATLTWNLVWLRGSFLRRLSDREMQALLERQDPRLPYDLKILLQIAGFPRQ